MEEELSPELSDIIENIKRYCATNKDVHFIYGFVGFKKDPKHQCIDCGVDCDAVDDTKTQLGAYGNLFDLRELLNNLRNMIEDETGRDNFVNL